MNTYTSSIFCVAIAALLTSCQTVTPKKMPPLSEDMESARQEITGRAKVAVESAIPDPVGLSPALPLPKPKIKEPTHTVIVNDVPVSELLFSLARDAELNFDIAQNVTGSVTLNAINQPLEAILDRISESADLTYEIKNSVLKVRKDTPYLQNYRIDYINMARSSQSSVTVSTLISATGQGASGEGSTETNNSATEVVNNSENNFWNSLYENISAIIYLDDEEANSESDIASSSATETAAAADASESGDSSDDSNKNIVINRESGVVAVRANKRQHAEIEAFINEVLFSTQRQVLIEVTIAEVSLSDSYQAGIDWSLFSNRLDRSASIAQTITDIDLFDRPSFTVTVDSTNSDGDTIQSTLSALETFGDVSIMSSPKVMALNNQTALLKVVDNVVYFTVEVNIEPGSDNSDTLVTYETEVNTVPVGFVMSVTPYISENDLVTLNVRPTISRVIGQARDPNPALAEVGVTSEIPIIQVREVESILKVGSGDTAVMGGLMQNQVDNNSRGIPFVSKLPGLGRLFRYDSDSTEKTELVIFIRPVVIKHASLNGDLHAYKKYFPDMSSLSMGQHSSDKKSSGVKTFR